MQEQAPTGEVLRSWRRYATVWAAVEPVSGAERLEGERMQASLTHRVVMRALRVQVRPRDRVRFGDRVLEVEYVADHAERGVRLELMASERVDG